MNIVKSSSFLRSIKLNFQSTRNDYTSSKPYEEIEGRFTKNRRYGYRSRYHEYGLYPRLKNQNNVVKSSYNDYRPLQLNWKPKKALMGQNDYIDILGNESIKPYEVLKDVPWWLKGFGGNELQMLQRQQVVKSDWKFTRPKKWLEMQGRMDFLYKFLNYRKKPPFLK